MTQREMLVGANSWSEISRNDQSQQKGATQRPSTPHF
jgi:hypothetical protein